MGQRQSPKSAVEGPLGEPHDGDQSDVDVVGAESIGRYLRRERRLRGISVDDLAGLTRIPVRSIERLEAGHFDRDPDGFVRGFVRTVADALGLDPQETLSRMLGEPSLERKPTLYRTSQLPTALVGLALVVLVALAFGVVRTVTEAPESRMAPLEDPSMVWRRDPVRNLAEAHAAVRIGADSQISVDRDAALSPELGPESPAPDSPEW